MATCMTRCCRSVFIAIYTQIHIYAFEAPVCMPCSSLLHPSHVLKIPRRLESLAKNKWASLLLPNPANVKLCNHVCNGIMSISDKNLLCLFNNLRSSFSSLMYQGLLEVSAIKKIKFRPAKILPYQIMQLWQLCDNW